MNHNVVIDASAALALLLQPGRGDEVRRAVGDACLMAPTVFPYEVTNVIRRLWSARMLTAGQADAAWTGLAKLNVELWQWETLRERVWQLKGSITSYDAGYVALAEIMGCPLVTSDAKLASMARCEVRLVA